MHSFQRRIELPCKTSHIENHTQNSFKVILNQKGNWTLPDFELVGPQEFRQLSSGISSCHHNYVSECSRLWKYLISSNPKKEEKSEKKWVFSFALKVSENRFKAILRVTKCFRSLTGPEISCKLSYYFDPYLRHVESVSQFKDDEKNTYVLPKETPVSIINWRKKKKTPRKMFWKWFEDVWKKTWKWFLSKTKNEIKISVIPTYGRGIGFPVNTYIQSPKMTITVIS